VKALQSELESDVATPEPVDSQHSLSALGKADYLSQSAYAPSVQPALDFQYLLTEGTESSV